MPPGMLNCLNNAIFKFSHIIEASNQHKFQAILQLIQLVDALAANNHTYRDHSNNKHRENHKLFDYIDAITNFMVRTDEVVAAVTCVSESTPSHHIISINSPASEAPSTDVE
jgi:hypothetical protein